MAQSNGVHFSGSEISAAQTAGGGSIHGHDAQSQTWEAMESYFECITTCSLDDGECVTHCVEQLREHA